MSDWPPADTDNQASVVTRAIKQIGESAGARIDHGVSVTQTIGGISYLLYDALRWTVRSVFVKSVKLRRDRLAEQMIRVGVRSIGIVVLVQMFIGCILALQLAPTLDSYGQLDQIAVVVAIAVVRELGPLITAIVLSGFAGASIAAEIAAMVESEEIKALKAHALNPIHFLIVPRFLATVFMIVGLAVIADIVGILGGFMTAWAVLGMSPGAYIDLTQQALVIKDFLTGLVKAGVFGMLISMIACYQGLNVSGGAVGVGKATTDTVVKSIVAIIGMDAVFTAVFYTLGL